MATVSKTSAQVLIFFVKCYQYVLSPLLGPRCRFYPTCSEYTKQSLQQHGVFKGLYLSVARILRCQPFSKGGLDPVPQSIKSKKG